MKTPRVTRIVAALAALLVPGLVSAADRWEFEVLLNDKEIGQHTFDVSRTEDGQRMETEASFDVRFLFVTAFRYRHQNTEVWRDGCLSSIDAITNNNGETLAVNGGAAENRFDVAGPRGSESLTGCVQTFAYWNPDILDADKLLNSQTGEYEAIDVVYAGADTVDVGGTAIDADRYTMTAKGGDISLWYSRDDQRWLALEAPAKGGRTIRYRPVSVPPPQDDAGIVADGE